MSGYFAGDPVATLETMEDVRAAIQQPKKSCLGFSGLDVYKIKSLWLMGLIDEIAAEGRYPYNADVKQLASERLGLPPGDYHREGDTLSLLIYNAQSYRRSDRRRAAGFEPLTQALIERALAEGKMIEVLTDGIFSGESVTRLKPRNVNGKAYAMRPHARRSYVMAIGQPARLAS